MNRKLVKMEVDLDVSEYVRIESAGSEEGKSASEFLSFYLPDRVATIPSPVVLIGSICKSKMGVA